MEELKGNIVEVTNLASKYLSNQPDIDIVEVGVKMKVFRDQLFSIIDRDSTNNSTQETEDTKA